VVGTRPEVPASRYYRPPTGVVPRPLEKLVVYSSVELQEMAGSRPEVLAGRYYRPCAGSPVLPTLFRPCTGYGTLALSIQA
jgi:hypothetical protein